MTRSTYTNKLIKALLDNGSNTLDVRDTEGSLGFATGFKQACELIDSAEDTYITIDVHRKTDNYNYGYVFLVFDNQDEEQLSDYCIEGFIETCVESVNKQMGV